MPLFSDKFDEYTDQIRDMVANMEIERAIERFLKLVEPIEHPLLVDITIIQGNLRALRRGLSGLSFEEGERIRIRNCSQLLMLLQDAKRDKAVEKFFYETIGPRQGPPPRTPKHPPGNGEPVTVTAIIYAVLRSDDSRVVPQNLNLSVEAIIGRNDDCDIVIDEPRISRQHTRIFVQNEQVYVEDLGSINKTVINGKIINQPTLISQSCTIRLHDIWISLDLAQR